MGRYAKVKRRGQSFSRSLQANFEHIKTDHREFCIGVGLETLNQLIIGSPVGDPDSWEVNRVAKEYNADVAAYNSDLRQDPANTDKRGHLKRGRKLNDSMKIVKPDGYVGGAFRGGWSIGFGERPGGFSPANRDATGDETKAKGEADLLKFKTGQMIRIGNNAPYGVLLEFEGHSKQAPLGIVRPVENRFESYARDIGAALANKPKRS